MRTRATIRREAGFSLVEMLVALAVAGLMASAVVMSITMRPAPIEREAERLLARFHEARETALVTGRVIGFAPEPDGAGYLFLRHADGDWRDYPAHPAFAPHDLPAGLRLHGETGRETGDAPLVWFDPTGVDQPFELLLQDGRRDLFLVRDGDGALSIETPEAMR
ncbi:type II secretion system protein GspH [Marinicauda salina]|uniref:Type II secretion system protein H n=1 Tax=Marinicauda salina TaxID=2135793 RepID=A0A2U2BSY5_9PROT|nr:GspH/FimT family pseudopilin [Marinicauda salina]PWE17114.1 type II secretion system protein GspH [Marinicauda salina]